MILLKRKRNQNYGPFYSIHVVVKFFTLTLLFRAVPNFTILSIVNPQIEISNEYQLKTLAKKQSFTYRGCPPAVNFTIKQSSNNKRTVEEIKTHEFLIVRAKSPVSSLFWYHSFLLYDLCHTNEVWNMTKKNCLMIANVF